MSSSLATSSSRHRSYTPPPTSTPAPNPLPDRSFASGSSPKHRPDPPSTRRPHPTPAPSSPAPAPPSPASTIGPSTPPATIAAGPASRSRASSASSDSTVRFSSPEIPALPAPPRRVNVSAIETAYGRRSRASPPRQSRAPRASGASSDSSSSSSRDLDRAPQQDAPDDKGFVYASWGSPYPAPPPSSETDVALARARSIRASLSRTRRFRAWPFPAPAPLSDDEDNSTSGEDIRRPDEDEDVQVPPEFDLGHLIPEIPRLHPRRTTVAGVRPIRRTRPLESHSPTRPSSSGASSVLTAFGGPQSTSPFSISPFLLPQASGSGVESLALPNDIHTHPIYNPDTAASVSPLALVPPSRPATSYRTVQVSKTIHSPATGRDAPAISIEFGGRTSSDNMGTENQTPLQDWSSPKTAVVHPDGHFESRERIVNSPEKNSAAPNQESPLATMSEAADLDLNGGGGSPLSTASRINRSQQQDSLSINTNQASVPPTTSSLSTLGVPSPTTAATSTESSPFLAASSATRKAVSKKLGKRLFRILTPLPEPDALEPLSEQEVKQSIESFAMLGYDVHNRVGKSPGWAQVRDVTDTLLHTDSAHPSEKETGSNAPVVKIPDIKTWEKYIAQLREERLKALGITTGPSSSNGGNTPTIQPSTIANLANEETGSLGGFSPELSSIGLRPAINPNLNRVPSGGFSPFMNNSGIASPVISNASLNPIGTRSITPTMGAHHNGLGVGMQPPFAHMVPHRRESVAGPFGPVPGSAGLPMGPGPNGFDQLNGRPPRVSSMPFHHGHNRFASVAPGNGMVPMRMMNQNGMPMGHRGHGHQGNMSISFSPGMGLSMPGMNGMGGMNGMNGVNGMNGMSGMNGNLVSPIGPMNPMSPMNQLNGPNPYGQVQPSPMNISNSSGHLNNGVGSFRDSPRLQHLNLHNQQSVSGGSPKLGATSPVFSPNSPTLGSTSLSGSFGLASGNSSSKHGPAFGSVLEEEEEEGANSETENSVQEDATENAQVSLPSEAEAQTENVPPKDDPETGPANGTPAPSAEETKKEPSLQSSPPKSIAPSTKSARERSATVSSKRLSISFNADAQEFVPFSPPPGSNAHETPRQTAAQLNAVTPSSMAASANRVRSSPFSGFAPEFKPRSHAGKTPKSARKSSARSTSSLSDASMDVLLGRPIRGPIGIAGFAALQNQEPVNPIAGWMAGLGGTPKHNRQASLNVSAPEFKPAMGSPNANLDKGSVRVASGSVGQPSVEATPSRAGPTVQDTPKKSETSIQAEFSVQATPPSANQMLSSAFTFSYQSPGRVFQDIVLPTRESRAVKIEDPAEKEAQASELEVITTSPDDETKEDEAGRIDKADSKLKRTKFTNRSTSDHDDENTDSPTVPLLAQWTGDNLTAREPTKPEADQTRTDAKPDDLSRAVPNSELDTVPEQSESRGEADVSSREIPDSTVVYRELSSMHSPVMASTPTQFTDGEAPSSALLDKSQTDVIDISASREHSPEKHNFTIVDGDDVAEAQTYERNLEDIVERSSDIGSFRDGLSSTNLSVDRSATADDQNANADASHMPTLEEIDQVLKMMDEQPDYGIECGTDAGSESFEQHTPVPVFSHPVRSAAPSPSPGRAAYAVSGESQSLHRGAGIVLPTFSNGVVGTVNRLGQGRDDSEDEGDVSDWNDGAVVADNQLGARGTFFDVHMEEVIRRSVAAEISGLKERVTRLSRPKDPWRRAAVEVDESDSDFDGISDSSTDSKQAIESLSSRVDRLLADVSNILQTRESLSSPAEQSSTDFARLLSENEVLTNQVKEVEKLRAEHDRTVADLTQASIEKGVFAQQVKDLERVKSENQSLISELAHLKSARDLFEKQKSSIEKMKSENERLITEHYKLKAEHQVAVRQGSESDKQISRLSAKVDALVDERDESKSEIAKLNGQILSYAETSATSKTLLQSVRSGLAEAREQAERDRSRLLSELSNKHTEIEVMRVRIRVETQEKDRQQEEYDREIRRVRNERDSALTTLRDELSREIDGLKRQHRIELDRARIRSEQLIDESVARATLSHDAETKQLRAQIERLRIEAVEKDEEIKRVRSSADEQLIRSTDGLAKAQSEHARLSDRCMELANHLGALASTMSGGGEASRETEDRFRENESKLQERIYQADEARRLAEERVVDAERRASEADGRASESERRAAHAEQRASTAEHRVAHLETKSYEMENRMKEVQARATEAITNAAKHAISLRKSNQEGTDVRTGAGFEAQGSSMTIMALRESIVTLQDQLGAKASEVDELNGKLAEMKSALANATGSSKTELKLMHDLLDVNSEEIKELVGLLQKPTDELDLLRIRDSATRLDATLQMAHQTSEQVRAKLDGESGPVRQYPASAINTGVARLVGTVGRTTPGRWVSSVFNQSPAAGVTPASARSAQSTGRVQTPASQSTPSVISSFWPRRASNSSSTTASGTIAQRETSGRRDGPGRTAFGLEAVPISWSTNNDPVTPIDADVDSDAVELEVTPEYGTQRAVKAQAPIMEEDESEEGSREPLTSSFLFAEVDENRLNMREQRPNEPAPKAGVAADEDWSASSPLCDSAAIGVNKTRRQGENALIVE